MTTAAAFVDQLRQLGLLEPAQFSEVTPALLDRFPEPVVLAQELCRRRWLTPYQAKLLLAGRGGELLLRGYVLLEPLGEGGMGQVFKARQRNLGRVVALKLIRKERLTQGDHVRRFQREIRANAQLDHPNIVRAFDADEVDGIPFFTMEYVAGTDLDRRVEARGPLPVALACDCIRQTALGLQHAYERGLIHRDIKPSNLLLSAFDEVTGLGTVKILDMGLARLERGDGMQSTRLTQEGSVMGTPDFLAPEQALGAEGVDIRADLYSLGATFYFLLTGQVPFPGGTMAEKLLKHQLHQPSPVERVRPDIPPAIAAVVRKLMAKRPEDRYQTPAQVAAVLAAGGPLPPADTTPGTGTLRIKAQALAPTVEYQPPAPRPSRHRLPVAFGVGGLVLSLVLAAFLFWPDPKPPTATVAEPPTVASPEQELEALLARAQGPSIRPEPLRDEIIAFCCKYPGTELAYRAGKLLPGLPPLVNSIGMKLAPIPPGSFLMGSPASERIRGTEEGPQHDVAITRPFYLGIHEVTQAQYAAVMGQHPSAFAPAGASKDRVAGLDTGAFPVETVSWQGAQAFCDKLSALPEEQKHGRKYRLPTEAEWEYACRGGAPSLQPFPFAGKDGQSLSSTQANCNGDFPYGNAGKGPNRMRPMPVGGFAANGYGLFDMHGNVWEWTADWFGPYGEESLADPTGPDSGTLRVLRGGSWATVARDCRAASRTPVDAAFSFHDIGFRVVLVVP